MFNITGIQFLRESLDVRVIAIHKGLDEKSFLTANIYTF